MNFLQLGQMVCRESGTFTGTQPSAMTSQTGRLLKVVNWTAYAYDEIQTMYDWWWMRAEFSSTTSSGTSSYTPASFSLTDLAKWIVEDDSMTCYETAEGVADEQAITYIPWKRWRAMYERGTQTNARPVYFSVSPDNELCFGPVPDDTYTIRGEYQKAPTTLSANTDTPTMPARYHAVIAWRALMLLQEHDEAQLNIATASRKYRELMSSMRRDQLPTIGLPDAIA